MFYRAGSVIGIVVSKLDAIELAMATHDIAQPVNFVIKGDLALSFVNSYGVKVATT